MKTTLSIRIAQETKTNLLTEADALNTTLSRHIAQILINYETTNPSRKTAKITSKSNNAARVAKKSTK